MIGDVPPEFDALIERRRTDPGDDVISELVDINLCQKHDLK